MTMDERSQTMEQLSAYLDGELPEADAAKVEHAIAADASLAAELAALKRTRDLVRRLPRKTSSPDFVANVLAHAERLRLVTPHGLEAPDRSFQWVRYLATAAVLLVAGGVGVVITAMLWTTPSAPQVVKRPKAQPVVAIVPPAARNEDRQLSSPVHNLTLANSEVIYSHDIDQAMKQVSEKLAAEGVEAAAFSRSNTDGLDQVRILAYVPAEQASALRSAIKGLSAAGAAAGAADEAADEAAGDKALAKTLERAKLNALNTCNNTAISGLAGENTLKNGSRSGGSEASDALVVKAEEVTRETKETASAEEAPVPGPLARQQAAKYSAIAQPIVIIIRNDVPAPVAAQIGANEADASAAAGVTWGGTVPLAAKPGGTATTAAASKPASMPASAPASSPAK